MLLLDMGEEGRVAEVALGTGTDELPFLLQGLFLLKHRYIEFY